MTKFLNTFTFPGSDHSITSPPPFSFSFHHYNIITATTTPITPANNVPLTPPNLLLAAPLDPGGLPPPELPLPLIAATFSILGYT